MRRWKFAAIVMFMTAMMAWPSAGRADSTAFDAVKRLGRGINILGYDGVWQGHVGAPFKFRNFRRIREAGFNHVRINFQAFDYMTAEGAINSIALNALDDVLAATVDAGLVPILDQHSTSECQQDVARCRQLLSAFWQQTVVRYRDKYPSLIFEILNEPGGAMKQDAWNDLALSILKIIRSVDRDRMVIVAALNAEPTELQALRLPEDDRRLILTTHYYSPFDFTHQGARWSSDPPPTGRHWGSRADIATMDRDFSAIDQWAKAQRRPLYLGEFGVYDAADLDDRVRYVGAVARRAEQLGWAWGAWQFDHDFAVFDTDRDMWNAPLLRALVPQR